MSFIALESAMKKPEAIIVTVPATYAQLHLIGGYVQSFLRDVAEIEGTPEDEILAVSFDVELAVHEICNNIIEHAYGHENGQIVALLSYERATNCVNINLYDRGKFFDETTVPQPDMNIPQTGGYGLFLVHQLLDGVTYSRNEDGNHWLLTKFL